MRHFERKEIAKRYAKYRPQVHDDIIETVARELNWSDKVATAVDYACGTGHSTVPLLKLADKVSGCDVSAEMLTEAKQFYPEIEFKLIEDDVLPFADGSVNLLSVGFAFHWLEQPTFLGEVARVLAKEGLFVIYNMIFPGVMESNEQYHDWHHHSYIAKYATPKRNRTPLRELLNEGDYGLEVEQAVLLSLPQRLSALELRNYLTTQSNISVAVEAGEPLSAIDACLDEEIAPYFSQPVEVFEYKGQAAVLRRT